MSFFENLSCLAMLMLVLWPEYVWDPRIFRISSSVQFSRSFVSDSLQPHTAASQASLFFTNSGACSNSCSLNWWCYPTISYSDVPFSSRLQSFPTTGTFPVSQFFTPVGQSIGVSASASILPMNIQDWFLLGLTSGFPCSPRDSQESYPTPQFKRVKSSAPSFLYSLTFTAIPEYWKKPLTRQTFVGKVMSLLFNMLSRLVIAFRPRSKHLLISWMQSPSAVILGPQITVSIVSPSICKKWWDQMPWSWFSECSVLSQFFHSLLSLSSRGS